MATGETTQHDVSSTSGAIVVKRRYLYQPGALRIMRERECVSYARRAIPRVVDGMNLLFPDTQVSFGLRITAQSHHLEGHDLLHMLYEPEMREMAFHIGLTTLQAFHSADVSPSPFRFFSTTYPFVRWARIMIAEMLHGLLARDQKAVLAHLVTDYTWSGIAKPVLLHGDLHASHVIVNLVDRSLGLIDLEAMRIGKAATNFAQLWESYYLADPVLGQIFYEQYIAQFSHLLDDRFDIEVRAELAMRCCSQIRAGRRSGNHSLEKAATNLLFKVLAADSFEAMCLGEATT